MDGIEQICFQIISTVGMARSCYIEAIREARQGAFEKAEQLIEEGRAVFVEGHQAHAKLLQKEAGGEHVAVRLLLLHAEDQLMSAEDFGILAVELLETCRVLYAGQTEQKQEDGQA